MNDNGGFNLSTVFAEVAAAVPDATLLVWRDRRFTYSQMDARIDAVAYYLAGAGLSCHTERRALAGHESGQDHLGIYLRNGNEYLETMVASYRARVAPFNVSFRYVEDELIYLLNDAKTKALVYAAEFAPRVEAIRAQVPTLEILIQVGDESGNALLSDAVDYESVVTTPAPAAGMPTPSPDDLYILYTGGTTGMPKGVLWRQHDIFISSMGGRPFGRDHAFASYAEIAEQARNAAGSMSLLMIPPFMHGAAKWAAYYVITMGGRLVIPDDVDRMRPDKVLRLAEREQVMSMPIVGDAIARPLLDEIEKGDYDLSELFVISNGAAPLTPSVRARLVAALPHATVTDSVGSSETGAQMSAGGSNEDSSAAPAFTPLPDTSVVSDDLSRVLGPGEGEGWLARRNLIPLGYLGDEAKTARTFPTIGSTRWSVPGDRAGCSPTATSNCWAVIRSPSTPAGRRSSLKKSSARSQGTRRSTTSWWSVDRPSAGAARSSLSSNSSRTSSSPMTISSRRPASTSRPTNCPRRSSAPPRFSGPRRARPITAGRRLRHWTRRENAGHLLTVAADRVTEGCVRPPSRSRPQFACRISVQITVAA